jgi:transcriptional regulator with XRE-family HTH domain
MEMGDRIAAYRKRRGLSQEALAGLIGMSRSWLSQVERGIRKVDRLSTLTNLAVVLRVDVAELVGRDWRLSRSDSTQVDAIESIRKALSSYSSLLEEAPSSIWPLPQLRSAVVEAHRANKAAKYQAASAMLPDILRVADAYGSHPAADAREVHLTRCFAYAAAAKLLIKIGESHLG